MRERGGPGRRKPRIMKTIAFLSLLLSFFLYAVSWAVHLASFRRSQSDAHQGATLWMRAGFAVSTVYFILEAVRMNSPLPVVHLPQALAFFAWSIAFVYSIPLGRIQSAAFGLVLTPLLALLTGCAAVFFPIQGARVAAEADGFFIAHIVSAFFAYACFTIAFAAGILYLIQRRELKARRAGTFYHKLPALEPLEKLIFQPMGLGTLLLCLAVTVGFFWSHAEFGEYWLTDPKTVSTLFVIALYSLILYLRYGLGIRGKRVALAGLAAFALLILTFVGLRFVGGSHNFLQ